MNCFEKKVVVITGAGSGIGRALALQLARKGAFLALSNVNENALQETLAMMPKGERARGYHVDVSKREAVFSHAEQVQRDFGTAHFLFNNAGTTLVGTFAHLTVDEIEWQLNINLWGVIYGTKAFLPMMLSQREGRIINMSSVFGMVGYPLQSAYNMSKFGVRGLTECLWSELEGTGVSAICVHPGGIRTNIGKDGRRCAAAAKEEDRFEAEVEKLLLTAPEKCAADIIAGIERGKRRILTGNKSTSIYWLTRLLPNAYPAILKMLAA